ncbi:MAG: ankyrin repeat domain-containing protein [Kiritimatiellae bacterium]|nr:ankyrin repeat domain-containing protein [Kiritimatiellia bacterium]
MSNERLFLDELKQLQEPNFSSLRKLSENRLRRKNLIYDGYKIDLALKEKLQHGIKILESDDELDGYAYLYWNKHCFKFEAVYKALPVEVFSGRFDVVDWGCGTGVGLVVLHDFIKGLLGTIGLANLRQVVLVEPSSVAINRAEQTVRELFRQAQVLTLNKRFEEFTESDFSSVLGVPRVHLFSNVLDLLLFENSEFCAEFTRRVRRTAFQRDEYIVCVSPSVKRHLLARFNAFIDLLIDGERWIQTVLFEQEITAASTTMILKIVHVQNRRIKDLCEQNDYSPELFAQKIRELDASIFYDMVAIDDIEGVRAFIIRGIEINSFDQTGWPPIMIASKYGAVNVMQLLLEGGANENATNATGATPLQFAAKYGEIKAAELLLKHGALVNLQAAKNKRTALTMAARYNHPELISLLLECGANVDIPDQYDQTALYMAAAGDFVETARILLEHGASPDVIAANGLTPRSVAEINGRFNVVKLFTR